MNRSVLFTLSTVAHVALILGLGRMHVQKASAATSIQVLEVAEAEKPPPPPPPPEAPQVPEPPHPRPQRATPRPAPAAAPEAPRNALDSLPNFGLELGGMAAGGSGFAVRQGTGPLNARPAPVKKTLAPTTRLAPADECTEPDAKPTLIDLPRPAYTDEARAAGIEGKVRLRITVDDAGVVVNVEVLAGLGHGLDEAAVAAARAARFQAAVRCGKPTGSSFTVSMRFSAA